MTKLDEMYAPQIMATLNTPNGRDFLVYILRKLKYCDIIERPDEMAVRNAGIKILEDCISIAGIRVNVLNIE